MCNQKVETQREKEEAEREEVEEVGNRTMEDAKPEQTAPPVCPVPDYDSLLSFWHSACRPTTRPRDPGTTFSELPVPSLQQRCT